MRAKLVHAHSRKPHPTIVRKLCRCTFAQLSHNLSTFSDAPAHLLHKSSGTCRECPAHKFCTIFSGTWLGLKICLCTGNECLKISVERVFREKHGLPKTGFVPPRQPFDPCMRILGNGRNTVSRVLFRRRKLTEPHWVLGGKLGEFCEKLGEFAFTHK